MNQLEQRRWTGDLGLLLVLATVRVALHALSNHQYGWHRDELAMLDDARHLAWGYVAYPPLTPAIGSVALGLFGPSLVGVRLFSSLAQAAAMVLAGLSAREFGGGRAAQVLAALAVAIAPLSMIQGALFQYVSFDYLLWVVVAYSLVRLLKGDDRRWWVAIGAGIGLGMMTRYTMAFWVLALVGGVLLTPARRYLATPWLWAGVGVSLVIFLPNLLWQVEHSFVSVTFLQSINARDAAIGRTSGFVPEQFIVSANPVTVPIWIAGLYALLRGPLSSRYRLLGWMFLIAFGLLWALNGRSYYLAPAYPLLLAAGAVRWEGWLAGLAPRLARVVGGATWGLLAAGGLVFAGLMLPVAPVNSDLWRVSSSLHDNFVEQIGWPELTETVAEIYAGLSPADRARAGILTRNYGEAGAINLYGPDLGLPPAISGVNSYWLRGYGDPPPEILIVVGFSRERADQFFESCDAVGRITNRYGVANEESTARPVIYLCRRPRLPWPDLWAALRAFG